MKFDPTKPVQTRDGRKARILATDVRSDHPIIAVVEISPKEERVHHYTFEGTLCHTSTGGLDLMNVPEKREFWINVYKYHTAGAACQTREDADRAASADRIACVKVTYKVGEGLDGPPSDFH